jgi:hypothetical protein
MPHPIAGVRQSVASLASCLLLANNFAFANEAIAARLVYLDLSGKVIVSNATATDTTTLVQDAGRGPDGIAVDFKRGHIYWTLMGRVSDNDGSIKRSNLDGSNVVTLVPSGGTHTPKQLKLDLAHGKLYWSDREGMRVMRANLDGSSIETLIITGTSDEHRKDQARWCVGLALDIARGHVYWTQKGGDNAMQGTIKRAKLDIPKGENPASRSDIELLFAGLPEPIDLEFDLTKRHIYWSDRGDNTISRAPMDKPVNIDPRQRTDREILVKGLNEAIGIALDLQQQRMYYTSLMGELGTARLDGQDARWLFKDRGRLTGIALIERSD